MHNNSTLADSSSAENSSAPKISVNDSGMPEESRSQKKNFQKQILWVTDTATAAKLEVFFDVVAFGDDSKIAPGRVTEATLPKRLKFINMIVFKKVYSAFAKNSYYSLGKALSYRLNLKG